MAKAAKKAATTDTTLTLKEIGVTIAEQFELPKSHAQQIMAETVAMMQKQLKKGGKVRISGLGILQVRKTAARKGVNPATGEAIKIKAGKRLKSDVAEHEERLRLLDDEIKQRLRRGP